MLDSELLEPNQTESAAQSEESKESSLTAEDQSESSYYSSTPTGSVLDKI